jgi:hypothetical protein
LENSLIFVENIIAYFSSPLSSNISKPTICNTIAICRRKISYFSSNAVRSLNRREYSWLYLILKLTRPIKMAAAFYSCCRFKLCWHLNAIHVVCNLKKKGDWRSTRRFMQIDPKKCKRDHLGNTIQR